MRKCEQRLVNAKRRGKQTRLWLVIGLCSLLLAGGGGYWWSTREAATPIAPPPMPAQIEEIDSELLAEIDRLFALINHSPRNPAYRSQLGMVYQANGLPRHSVECYRQAIELGGSPARLWYLIALAQERMADLEEAVASLSRALAGPDAPHAAGWRRAQWLLELGRFDDAEQQLRDNLAQRPDEAATWYTLAELHIARRDPDRAIHILNERELLTGSNAGPAHQLLVSAYRQLGMDDKAAAAATRASSAAPVWRDPIGSELSHHLLGAQKRQLAISRLMAQQRYDQAIPILEQLLQDDATDHRVLNLLATCHLRLGRIERAAGIFREAARNNPRHYGSNLNLASALWRWTPSTNERLEDALRHVDIAIALRPSAGEAHELRGAILAALEQYEPAIESLLHSFALDSNDFTRLLRAATLQVELERWSDAEATYRAVLAHEDDQPHALIGLARCLLEQRKYDQADEIIARVVALLGSETPQVNALLAQREQAIGAHLWGPQP